MNNIGWFLESKHEFTESLVDVLFPHICNGFHSMYDEAVKMAVVNGRKNNVLSIFQDLLLAVQQWNTELIAKETQRIKRESMSDDYMDSLVKACIKSHILVLTFLSQMSSSIGQGFFNTLSTDNFVHKCYIESAKDFFNSPFLFYKDPKEDDITVKKNELMIKKCVQECITRAVRKILPLSIIAKEFLDNTFNLMSPPIQQFQQTQPMQTAGHSIKKPIESKDIVKSIHEDNTRSTHEKVKDLLDIDKKIDKLLVDKKPSNIIEIDIKTKHREISPVKKLKEESLSEKSSRHSYRHKRREENPEDTPNILAQRNQLKPAPEDVNIEEEYGESVHNREKEKEKKKKDKQK